MKRDKGRGSGWGGKVSYFCSWAGEALEGSEQRPEGKEWSPQIGGKEGRNPWVWRFCSQKELEA